MKLRVSERKRGKPNHDVSACGRNVTSTEVVMKEEIVIY